MRLAGYVKSSLIDYPGKIAAVIFLSGCNYDCFFCHNRRLLDCDYAAVSKAEVFFFLEKRIGLLDGVVVSGGEPTMHAELPQMLDEIKALGYPVKLDTNGSNPEMVRTLLREGLMDYAAVDYKTPKADYRKCCGSAAEAERVLETIDILLHSGSPFEVRTTLIPEIGEKELVSIAGELPLLPRYVVNRYRVPEVYRNGDEDRVRLPPKMLWGAEKIRAVVAPRQPNIVV